MDEMAREMHEPAANAPNRLNTKVVAELLGVTPQRVRQIADQLGARREADGSWTYSAEHVGREATLRRMRRARAAARRSKAGR